MNAPRLVALLLTLSVFPVAQAAESSPAPKPNSASAPSATATELARILVPKESWTAGVNQLSQNVQQQMQSHPGASLHYPADFQDKVRGEVEKILPYDEFVAMHARQLATAFSDDEMKDVLAFYRTPAGRKWQLDYGKVSQAVSTETNKRFEQKMPEVMSRLGKMAQEPGSSVTATKDKAKGSKPQQGN